MTEKKAKIMSIIKEYIDKYGFSPSIRELCVLYGCNSPATMAKHLKQLRDLGMIDFVDKKSRTIRIKE